jgi:hypothetical protein
MAYSVQPLAKGWAIKVSKPDGGKEFSPLRSRLERSWDPPSVRYNGSHDAMPVISGRGLYRVIHMSVKHYKNSQQMDYATDHGNSYADRERNSPSFFLHI